MRKSIHRARIERCVRRMEGTGLDVILLTKPSNMFYLTGNGRLCAYVFISRSGVVAIGVPQTDVEDVKRLATFDQIVGFENEVGMIHSIAHWFHTFGISSGTVGLEYSFLTQSMMGMLTHPHAKPEGVTARDCTHLMSELRVVKEPGEIESITAAARVADAGMREAVRAVKPGLTESLVARPRSRPCGWRGPRGSGGPMCLRGPARISRTDFPRSDGSSAAIWS